MAKVFVGIGTNLGDRTAYMAFAQVALGRLPQTQVVALSHVYQTEPVGSVRQGHYLNAVAMLETKLDPDALFAGLQQIESRAGRPPLPQRIKWAPRTLDLDMLLYENRVINSQQLVVPHPMMHQRWFVLKPLADLAPDVSHPLLGMTMAQLLARCEHVVNP